MYDYNEFEKASKAALKLAKLYCEKPYWKSISVRRRIDSFNDSDLVLDIEFFISDLAMEEERSGNIPEFIDGFRIYMSAYSNEFAPGCGLTTMDGKVHYS